MLAVLGSDAFGAYWLLDAIVITNVYEERCRREEFQLWILTVGKGASGELICDDRNGIVVYNQDLDYTDFSEPGIGLYFVTRRFCCPASIEGASWSDHPREPNRWSNWGLERLATRMAIL